MRQTILVLLICLTVYANSGVAQTDEPNSNTSKFVYCELVGTQKFLSTKVTITIDFGETKNVWKDNRLKDEVTGKVQVFNSMVDALNYMGEDGWEFVQAYVVTIGQQNVYHWLLKQQKQE